jgi:NMD protein affecting ribosome stability and mRNA decay
MGFQMKQANLRPHRPAAARRIAGHAQQDHILDPYQRQQKLDDDTVCPQCAAVYHKGRWQWGTKPENGPETLCPACRRINDKFPAGVVELRGALGRQQKEGIVRLARHQEEAESGEHPLNRIMTIDEDADGIVINTTDIHLPRRIGEAVERAFHGNLNEVFDEGGYFVRVNWTAET